MAIVLDATSGTGIGGLVSAGTLSHTCTGINLILAVGVRTNSITPGTVTYAGSAMTLASVGSTSAPVNSSLWYLVNPGTGANNIVFSLASSDRVVIGGMSYTGVQQSGQPDAVGSRVGTSAEPKGTLITITNNAILIGMIGNSTAGSITPGTSGNQRYNGTTLSPAWGEGLDLGPNSPAGAYVIAGATDSASSAWAIALASFSAVDQSVANRIIRSSGDLTYS